MPSSTSDTAKKREALEELLRSEGWAYFRVHVLKEWQGVGYQSRMGTALTSGNSVAPQATHQTALEMVRLLEWPVCEVRSLKGSLDDE